MVDEPNRKIVYLKMCFDSVLLMASGKPRNNEGGWLLS